MWEGRRTGGVEVDSTQELSAATHHCSSFLRPEPGDRTLSLALLLRITNDVIGRVPKVV